VLTLATQIQAAYESDHLLERRKAVKASDLPWSYEAITTEWLSEILRAKLHGAEVVGFELGTADNGSSNRRKIYLEYDQPAHDTGLPEALFCKATQDLSCRIMLGVCDSARIEVTFYNEIRPLLDIEAPQCLFARFDPRSFNSIIVLADLTGRVNEFCSHETIMTRKRVEDQLQLLATLHGTCYESRRIRSRLARFPTWPQLFRNLVSLGLREGCERGLLASEHVIPTCVYRRFHKIWPGVLASVQRHSSLPQTLAHCDVHSRNWYIAGNGEMGLADWQCASRAHWSRDVAYVISAALDVDERRALERELLSFYVDRLRSAGGPSVGVDEALTHYRQQLMSVLVWWAITLSAPDIPGIQDREVTTEFLRRTAVAIDDWNSLDFTL
jgi:hypothetical protein